MSIRKKKESAVKGMDLQRDTNEKVLKRQKILGGDMVSFFFLSCCVRAKYMHCLER